MMSLKPVSAEPAPCPICTAPAPLFGVVDFNRNCDIRGGVKLPLAGVPVYHRRCSGCGLLFTDAFAGWSHDDYKAHIYNEAYAAVDPEYLETRPRDNAGVVIELFGADRARRRVLDFGGGNDVLCAELRKAGFPVAVTYDPFVPAHAAPPDGTYDLIVSFETLEHLPDPVASIGLMVDKLAEPGLVMFSTLLQPADIESLGVRWWYVGPRNGHVSMFSRDALVKAWARHGCKTGSFNDHVHVAFRTLPDYAKHLFK